MVHRLDEVLARTDPFDLAQAIDRYVNTLSAEQIRGALVRARTRLNAYYMQEFSRVEEIEREGALRTAFAQVLKSNLRVLPLFGAPFCDAILKSVPADRAVAIGEESPAKYKRFAAIAAIAAALLIGGAAGEHYVSSARAQAFVSTPAPEPAVAVAQPARPVPAPSPMHRRASMLRPGRIIAQASPAAALPPPLPGAAPPPRVDVRRPVAPPAGQRRLPVAHGVAVVPVTRPKAAAAPAPSAPEALDVSSEPAANTYTDATPLPEVTAAPVAVPSQHAVTPSPAPRKRGWLHRAVMHLDPFKPHHP
jgi:hypothetical protein